MTFNVLPFQSPESSTTEITLNWLVNIRVQLHRGVPDMLTDYRSVKR